jgi:OmcA/MtrC family decaheme c-type cytochrome
MVNTANATFDFRPDGAAVTNTRDIVKIETCAACHDGQVLAHGSRKDPKYCMTCHTDQIKYSFSMEAPSSNGGLTLTGGVTGSTTQKRAETAIVDGRAIGNFPNFMHKLHMGAELVKTGYNFNANGGAMLFNEVGFPQDPANCTKCHTGTASTDPAVAKVTANGDNWKNNPSVLACGACHDGINFKTGAGVTLVDKAKDVAAKVAVGTTKSGHAAGQDATNPQCALCHTPEKITLVHRTTFATPNNLVTQAGLANFAYSIKSVTLNGARQPVIAFQIKKDGALVTSLAVPTVVTNVVSGQKVIAPTYEPIPGFAGGPSFYVAYAVPEDGITAPADFNTYQSVGLANLLVPSGSPKQGILTSDGAGTFTATLTGDETGQPVTATCKLPTSGTIVGGFCVNPSALVVPTTAKLVTGMIAGSFTQKTGVPTPYVAADVSVNPNKSASGGLARTALLAKLAVSGQERRVIVSAAKCNSCHDVLGTVPNFHGGARNDPTACNICHSNTRTSNGWAANSSTFIHGIHGTSKRTQTYTWAAVSATDTFAVGYPGKLSDCNQCHLPNTVNFGAIDTTTLLWPTHAAGAISTTASTWRNSPYVVAGTNYGNGFSFFPAGSTVGAQTSAAGVVTAAHIAAAGGETIAADKATLVSSPISSACFSCHDTAVAKAHMQTNGGAIYEARSTAFNKAEGCQVCHGAGKDFDTAVVHQ